MHFLFSKSLSLADAQPQLAVFKHMLATPVSTLACLSQNDCLLEKNQLQEQQKIAKKCYKRILSIFSQVGTLQTHERKSIKVASFLESLAYYFPPQSVTLKVIYQNDITKNCKVFTNQLLVEEALVCLINNAIESHKNEHKEIPLIILAAFVKEKKLFISIRDFGPGINWKNWLVQQFTPFSSKHPGNGLGLLFAKQVFGSLGGEAKLHKRESCGVEVMCVLPLAR